MEWLVGGLLLWLFGSAAKKNKSDRKQGKLYPSRSEYAREVADRILMSYVYRIGMVDPQLPHIVLVSAEVYDPPPMAQQNAFYGLAAAHALGNDIWAPQNAELPVAVPVPIYIAKPGQLPPASYVLLKAHNQPFPLFGEQKAA